MPLARNGASGIGNPWRWLIGELEGFCNHYPGIFSGPKTEIGERWSVANYAVDEEPLGLKTAAPTGPTQLVTNPEPACQFSAVPSSTITRASIVQSMVLPPDLSVAYEPQPLPQRLPSHSSETPSQRSRSSSPSPRTSLLASSSKRTTVKGRRPKHFMP